MKQRLIYVQNGFNCVTPIYIKVTPHDIIAIGASAGGVEALTHLVRGLPRDLPAAVFVVVHFPSHGTSLLPAILSAQGSLPAAQTMGRAWPPSCCPARFRTARRA